MALYKLLLLIIIFGTPCTSSSMSLSLSLSVVLVLVKTVGGVGFCSVHISGVSNLCWLRHLRLAALWRIT